jgi:RNA polymerase sigma-70 factor (ECF subfamily)
MVMLAQAVTDTDTFHVQPGAAPDQLRSDTSDETLIRLIADGEREAMALLYARHKVAVYRFILRITGNANTSDDLVSEVFLDVWRAAANFQAKSRVSTWLLAIARYKALSVTRRRADEPLDERAVAVVEDGADNPEIAVDKLTRRAVVRNCLTRLSPVHRQVMDLAYYHERTVEEIATILDIPINTVKTRMFYARSKMSRLLRQAGIEGA